MLAWVRSSVPCWPLRYRFALAVGFVALLSSAITFSAIYGLQYRWARAQVESEAEALLAEMIAVREWVARYGGVWTTEPGQFYLREENGYFLKSPAMVTKELSDLAAREQNYRFGITSLRLRNAENAPDPFELQALRAFEHGTERVAEFVSEADGGAYRLMVPLPATAPCLQCHADQGYQVGDIRGGLGVIVPTDDLGQTLASTRVSLIGGGLALVLGVTGVLVLLVRRLVVTPLGELWQMAVSLRQGDYRARCRIETGDEFQVVGEALNQMVTGLQAANDELAARFEGKKKELKALSEIALVLSKAGPLGDVLDEALEVVLRLTGMDAGVIDLAREGENGGPRYVARGLDSEEAARFRGPLAEDGRKPLSDGHSGSVELFAPSDARPGESEGWSQAAFVRLMGRDGVMGTLRLLSRSKRAIPGEAAPLLECASHQLGVAIENARFREQIEQMAILEERNRIARELHDSLAQNLAWIRLKSELVSTELRRGEWEKVDEGISEVRRVLDEACFDIRSTINGLRQHSSEGLVPAIRSLVSQFGKQTGLQTTFESPEGNVRASPVAEVHVLRILQEALTNVRKHAKATAVHVGLHVSPDHIVEVSVEDDGQGFSREKVAVQGHFGLRIMQERAERLGGSVAVETEPGRGTRVAVRVPMEPKWRRTLHG